MARPTNEDRLRDVHADALEEFDRVQEALYEGRMQCLEDRRFYSIEGAQWEGPIGEQFENRPRFEFNRVHLAVIRIINEYRNNRITVDFTPKDGTSRADLADTCDGLYRADEQDSGAQEAYDNAFEEGVGGGFGAWRLRACYEDEGDPENEKQRIRIEPIFDADSSVFFDLDAKRQDKADAKRCWVITSMTHASFIEQFKHDPASWPKSVSGTQFDWVTPTVVYVAEYYEVEEQKEVVRVFRQLDGSEKEVREAELVENVGMLTELHAIGSREVRKKRITTRKVHKYLMSGAGIEKDDGYIAGCCIPVVPFYGKRWFVDNVERQMGHVRLAKDAQRLMNSLLSWLTEIASRFDTEKPILSPDQVRGHATMWAEDNVKRYPYLLLNPVLDALGNQMPTQALAYTKAPNVPPAMAALIQIASQSLEDLLGNQQAGEQLQPNQSGKAVELIQQRLDMQVFIYMSNFGKAMKRSGEIWLSMAREIMVEDDRAMKTVSEDGAVDTVTLRQPIVDPKTGEQYLGNNLDEATFDIWVDVGPSSSSKRAATVRALTGLAAVTDDPQTRQVLTGVALLNFEGEGLQDLRDWVRAKLVREGAVKPTDDEKEQMAKEQANQQQDPQAAYLLASAEGAAAKAARDRAGTVESIAAAELKRAQTVKTLAEADAKGTEQHIATLDAMQRTMQPPPAPVGGNQGIA